MPELIIWKNQEIERLRRDIDRLFARFWDDFRVPFLSSVARETPSLDMSETKDSLIIKAEIPGVKPENLDISITGDILTIRGTVRDEFTTEGAGYSRRERRYGSFSRNVQLPCKVLVDDVEATYKEGILNIVMPKCKPEQLSEIKIKVT
ncbi:MAG: Hsp20/alpha crystallin family protein [Deltaproteobacteria bacterium]|nr:Hsp20/alpha crystallin family protein [Deltaproteobacteria bacterium]MBW1936390.1 Hsp20/alpha crystallin family protein [Deltaproteobacteria bacterium]MBW1977137.1 Hsp20/alpha crystallin family protein [Deltaproteobacteria bacterium]MBW2043582.1 Hsp20/alpha crystallin family protein [Deltaproteobacteria bacterium]MBW2299062.1 Hsp20/alpha crystallin family protein [Deltaproteobacteria bacterium]